MATQNQDLWTEKALVSIAAQGGTDITFQSLTETIDIDPGEKDIEQIVLTSGGRLVKFVPEGLTTVTIEAYPKEVGSKDISAATAGAGFFDLMQAEDTTQPLRITSTTQRDKYRLVICWTEDTTVTNAVSAATGANKQKRFIFSDGYFTAVKPSFTDGNLKYTITFKVPPRDESNVANIYFESTDGSASLTVLQSYTSATKL